MSSGGPLVFCSTSWRFTADGPMGPKMACTTMFRRLGLLQQSTIHSLYLHWRSLNHIIRSSPTVSDSQFEPRIIIRTGFGGPSFCLPSPAHKLGRVAEGDLDQKALQLCEGVRSTSFEKAGALPRSSCSHFRGGPT
ncbi:unnamed protein product [Prorocentrum cordatum]|uniref:Uncharacterized protein n=1 Tax=Prorocentrum cordatum TaxID=2364126 RepID=A0ABN9YEI8_9DINO|nr:unnamed protein product [Polarella glacialis]